MYNTYKMTAISLVGTSHIRQVNVPQDLLAIADLIEICFASTLDEDGRDYLRQLRWTARDVTYLSWLQGAAERITSPLYGFVWEEEGRIVGNLSLIPLYRRGKIIYLIANVAVHPDFRRRGIGRKLTQAALEHLRQRGVETAWLQVRDDNPAAYHLYLSLGFVERARRTTWLGRPCLGPVHQMIEGVTIHRRRASEWEQQLEWLRQVYPPDVAWNLPLNVGRLSPSPWHKILRFLRGEGQEHWSALQGDLPVGFLSWETTRSAADSLWLAAPLEREEQAILALLPHARAALAHRGRPLSLNYPAGRAGEAFLRAGFSHHQTLVWMSINLSH